MNCDVTRLSYDIPTTAGQYSTLTGVLAGVAFLAITLVLAEGHRRQAGNSESPRERLEVDARLLLALIFAFAGLVLATIQYAVLSGERGCSLTEGRAASEELLGGVAFAFSALLLLYAVVVMVSHSGVRGVAPHARFLVAVAAPPFALLLLSVGAEDVVYTPWQIPTKCVSKCLYVPADTAVRHLVDGSSLPFAGLAFVIALMMYRIGRNRVASRSKRLQRSLPVLIPYVSLCFSLGAVVWSTTFSGTTPQSRLGEVEILAIMIVAFVGLLLQSWVLSFGHDALESGPDDPPYPGEVKLTGASTAAVTTMTD